MNIIKQLLAIKHYLYLIYKNAQQFNNISKKLNHVLLTIRNNKMLTELEAIQYAIK
jgi:hypothetical protein